MDLSYCHTLSSILSSRAAYLYWTDWGSISKIERVQLDDGLSVAGNRRVIVGNGLEWPNGLAADAPNDRLYWADAKLDKIETSDLLVSEKNGHDVDSTA